ncbi:tetratricopeptide repeat protein [Rheinheimera sediminis]|uniref:tetratricopeptide repeat protein n=1 Tax=Rheinheimera sp. YQF-1 TaxID=2499626 RepID=UPI000FD91C8D|nr:tetratricopeptide repeat protein [Rheinheimera sp. YQF-1]RVT45699.1 tetratricopeptide repeat protein [Rheinheimera sp. YQF-1]
MRIAFCFFLLLLSTGMEASELTELLEQVKANPQAQLAVQQKQPASTASDFFLVAYSHYALRNKEAALEFSNKALTLEPDAELAARILLMQALTYGVFYRDTEQALEKLKLAEAILPTGNNPVLLALRMDILESFSQAYNQQGKTELAMKAATESLALATQTADKQRQLDAIIMLGRLHLQNNHLTKAYQHFKSALPLASELADQQAIASIHMRLGMAYQKLGQHERALQHFEESARLYQQLDSLSSQINALINIGDSQLVLNQTDKAQTTYNKALKLALDNQDLHMLISVYVSLSELELERNNLDQSEQLLLKAHQLASQVSAQSIKSETALFLVNVFIKKQNFSAAKQLLNEAVPQPDELPGYLKYKHLALSAELAALEQKWQQAYLLEKSANQLEIAQLNDDSKIQLDSLQSSLELQMQQEKQQQMSKEQQSQLQQWLFISLALLAITLLALLFFLSKQKKNRSNKLIQQPQWRSFTELLLHHHGLKTQGKLLVISPGQTTVMLKKGVQQVNSDLIQFRSLLDQALFWVEQDQEFWLYCESEQQSRDLQHQLLRSLPSDYQADCAAFPLHALLSEPMSEKDLDALRELYWYSLYLAQQQGLQGALQIHYYCHQNRPCSWQTDNLRQDLFNAMSLGLLEVHANDISLSDKLQQQLAQI